jgi:hypothetical protein
MHDHLRWHERVSESFSVEVRRAYSIEHARSCTRRRDLRMSESASREVYESRRALRSTAPEHVTSVNGDAVAIEVASHRRVTSRCGRILVRRECSAESCVSAGEDV